MALLYCLTPWGCEARRYPLSQVLKKLENAGPRGTQVGLHCLSVRSAFDLLLTSLHLPVGSEVLMTAANVPHMFEIVRRHGLIPVTFDLHTEDFAICEEDLKCKLNEKTSLVLIAHLFGGRTDLTPIVNHPHREDFVLVEDCAQLFIGDYYPSHCLSDFQLFSFGPIKTATALGGGILCYPEDESCQRDSIGERFLEVSEAYPVQSRLQYARRIMKYLFIKLLTTKLVFAVFYRLLRDPDRVLSSLAKNFNQSDLLEQLRVRPCIPLVRMMNRRMKGYKASSMHSRTELGRSITASVTRRHLIPGALCSEHRYWVFPIAAREKREFVKRFRQQGFDATSTHSMEVQGPRDSHLSRLFENLVFIPFDSDLEADEVGKIAELIDSSCDPTLPPSC